MKIITSDAEDHLLNFIESFSARDKSDQKGLLAQYFELSNARAKLSDTAVPDDIAQDIEKLNQRVEAFVEELREKLADLRNLYCYVFRDGSVLILAKPEDDEQKQALDVFYRHQRAHLSHGHCDYMDAAGSGHTFRKLANDKLTGARRMQAYELMCRQERLASIPARRKLRDKPLVMLVEDDSFTAYYTSRLIYEYFETMHVKTGEDAIINYIEESPDAVCMDVHLPGISGHETLNALKAIDARAHVIMLTVDTVRNNVVNAARNGAASYIRKPVKASKLIHNLRKSPFIPQGPVPIDSELQKSRADSLTELEDQR
mgnify:CR=1 FL=1